MSITGEVRRQLRDIDMRFDEPVGIVFSRDGYREAMHEDTVGVFQRQRVPETYMNLPFRVDNEQVQEVRVVDRMTANGAVRVEVSEPMRPMATAATQIVVLVGRALTKAQLCDVITAWCDANPGDDLEDALRPAVARYGRFE